MSSRPPLTSYPRWPSGAASASNKPSFRALQLEFSKLLKEPVEGFTFHLDDDTNLYKWHVGIFGPPDTLYAGGYFKALMEFPDTYPFAPPKVKFLTKMFHPNIYENGEVCISILHPPTDDPHSGEHPNERWNPTQNVRTILMSIISLLNEPNTFSPANVDAGVLYRKFKEGADNAYETQVKKQVAESRVIAEQEGIVIPKTLDEYVAPSRANVSSSTSSSSSAASNSQGNKLKRLPLEYDDTDDDGLGRVGEESDDDHGMDYDEQAATDESVEDE